MKYLLLNLFSSIIVTCSFAQKDTTKLVVKYKQTYIQDTLQSSSPVITEMDLLIGKVMTQFVDALALEKQLKLPAVSELRIVGSGETGEPNLYKYIDSKALGCYKTFTDSSISTIDLIFADITSVDERIPQITWNIVDSFKQIIGLNCRKATTDFRGRNYTAWFCTDIPISNGPWKLGGLPGLIIESYDSKGEISFKCLGYEKRNDIYFEKPIKTKNISSSLYRNFLESTWLLPNTNNEYLRMYSKETLKFMNKPPIDISYNESVRPSNSILFNNHLERTDVDFRR